MVGSDVFELEKIGAGAALIIKIPLVLVKPPKFMLPRILPFVEAKAIDVFLDELAAHERHCCIDRRLLIAAVNAFVAAGLAVFINDDANWAESNRPLRFIIASRRIRVLAQARSGC